MSYEKKRPNRSDHYQEKFLEIQMTIPENLDNFQNNDGMSARLSLYKYNDEIEELREELKREFWKLAEAKMTKIQFSICRKIADGYNQWEIANELGVNQSSISKCLQGNVDYKNGRRVYGGAIPKMKKLIAKHAKIQEILARIEELTEEIY